MARDLTSNKLQFIGNWSGWWSHMHPNKRLNKAFELELNNLLFLAYKEGFDSATDSLIAANKAVQEQPLVYDKLKIKQNG